jgi:hypothetical protein
MGAARHHEQHRAEQRGEVARQRRRLRIELELQVSGDRDASLSRTERAEARRVGLAARADRRDTTERRPHDPREPLVARVGAVRDTARDQHHGHPAPLGRRDPARPELRLDQHERGGLHASERRLDAPGVVERGEVARDVGAQAPHHLAPPRRDRTHHHSVSAGAKRVHEPRCREHLADARGVHPERAGRRARVQPEAFRHPAAPRWAHEQGARRE